MERREQRSAAAQAWRRWYHTSAWRSLRGARLAAEPLCRMCLPRVEAATVVDHVKEHKGNPDLFFDLGNTQSLCADHHDRWKQAAERSRSVAVDADGWPIVPPEQAT